MFVVNLEHVSPSRLLLPIYKLNQGFMLSRVFAVRLMKKVRYPMLEMSVVQEDTLELGSGHPQNAA